MVYTVLAVLSVIVLAINCQRQALTFSGHTNSVTSIDVQGSFLYSASQDGSIKKWKMDTGETVWTIKNQNSVQFIGVKVKGDKLYSVSYYNEIKKWSSLTGDELLTFIRNSTTSSITYVASVKVAVGTDNFLYSTANRQILKLDPETGREVMIFDGHSDEIWSITIGPDGLLYSGCKDGSINQWDTETGEVLKTFKGHVYGVNTMAVTSDGFLLSGSNDKQVKKWDIKSGEIKLNFTGHEGRVGGSLCVGKNGSLFSVSEFGDIKRWDINTGQNTASFSKNRYGVTLFCGSDGYLYAGSADNSVTKWDLNPDTTPNLLSSGSAESISPLAMHLVLLVLGTATWALDILI
jgi:WD40 repeat protein